MARIFRQDEAAFRQWAEQQDADARVIVFVPNIVAGHLKDWDGREHLPNCSTLAGNWIEPDSKGRFKIACSMREEVEMFRQLLALLLPNLLFPPPCKRCLG